MSQSIKVAILKSESSTEKGKILEKLTGELLETQNYAVKKQLRLTGMELDLLCVHKTNGKEIYVECKAYNESKNISAEVITKLFGVKEINKYAEAWLVVTAPLTKDAEGLVDKLKKDNNHDFFFYTPDKLIEAYVNAKVIQPSILSERAVEETIKDKNKIGNVSLVISQRGNFWAVETLNGGMPDGVIFTNALTSELVKEATLLDFFIQTEIFHKDINCKKVCEFPKIGIFANQVCPERMNLSDVYVRKINEIGMHITHPGKDVLSLEDIFIYPSLEPIEDEKQEKIDSKKLVELEKGLKKCLVFGEDLSGKTTLAQMLQKDINSKGFISLYLDAEDIKKADLNKFTNLLKTSFKKQYSDGDQYLSCFEDILSKDNSKISLIIDNYESLSIKRTQARADFHEFLNKHFENVIIFANKSMEIEVMADSETRKQLTGFIPLKIKELGYVLRDKLIEKWLTAGDGDITPDSDIHNKKIEISEKIRVAVGTNFIPTYPLYLLTILQLIETTSKNKLQGSSYAELYTYLIIQSLGSVNAKPEDLDFYLTYLSYLAYSFFRKGQRSIPLNELKVIYKNYSQEMDIDKEFDILHPLLNRAQILRFYDDSYSFSHNYSYYFFVAKYFADNIENDDIKQNIEEITKHLYRTEYANILIFLIHHSKSKSILEKIIKESSDLFKEVEPFALTNSASFEINKLIRQEVSFTIKDEKPREYRKKELAKRDEIEEVNEKDNKKEKEHKSKKDLGLFGEINLSFKLLEIMGQITQNYYGSLEGKRKAEILIEINSLGFRALGALLDDFGKFAESLKIEVLKVVEKKKAVDEAEKERIADKIIQNFTEMIVYAFLKRISNSVASKNIFPTMEKISEKDLRPGVQLVNLAARLNFPGGLHSEEIINLDRIFEKNYLARRILRILVIEYLYKFDMKISEKQSLCSKLEIKLILNKEKLG